MLLTVVFVKLWLLQGVELGKDEAAYWYWARHHLDASYAFVLFAVIRLADSLSTGSDTLLRLPIILASLGSGGLLLAACRRAGLAPADRYLAVICFLTSHWAWHTGTFLHPDGVLVPLWLATIAFAQRADRSGADSDWFATGLLCGLTALCKYSGCILVAGLLLALLLRRRRGLRPLLWCAAPCAVIASPLVWALWQLDFRLPFTLGSLSQVAADRHILWRAALFLLAPLLYISPPLLVLLYAGVFRAWRQRLRQGMDLLATPALSLLGTFAFFALTNGQVKGNWILPGFLGLWPLAFDGLQRRRGYRGWVAALILIGLGQAAIPAATLRWPDLARQLASASTSLNASYTAIVSPTDLPREPTFSWTERVCEYHGWHRFGIDLETRLRTAGVRVDRLSSAEYGLAYGLGRYLPSQPAVTVTDDERFAHIADVADQEQHLYLTRVGSRLPMAVRQHHLTPLMVVGRGDEGCGEVTCEVYLVPGAGHGSLRREIP